MKDSKFQNGDQSVALSLNLIISFISCSTLTLTSVDYSCCGEKLIIKPLIEKFKFSYPLYWSHPINIKLCMHSQLVNHNKLW